MRVVFVSLVVVGLAATLLRAGDQTILGQKLMVKNPSTPDKRKVTGSGKETDVVDTIVGDPSADGAELTISVNGDTPTTQTWSLPAITNPATGKPFWSGDAIRGFKYGDAKGVNGEVKKVQVKRSSKGVFQIKAQVDGKLGQVDLVPPDPGT